MNHTPVQKDTTAWIFQVWASFIIAAVLMCAGIYYLPVDAWIRGYLTMGFLFSLGSTFTLSKTIRDNHEANRIINRISEAKAEKMLTEFELK